MFYYEVKHDTMHKVWRKLSLTTRVALPEFQASQYAKQYAQDNQMNPHCISIRCVHSSFDRIEYTINSNATINRPSY